MQRSRVTSNKELGAPEQSDELIERGWESNGWRCDARAQNPVHQRLFAWPPSQNALQTGFLAELVMQESVVFWGPVLCVPAATGIQDDKIVNLA